jgi:F-type H+-transporting ATPase subunit b
MALLTPDIGLLFWMTVIFAIVFGVLGKWAFPVITSSLRKRNERIETSLRHADEVERRLEALAVESEAEMAEARRSRSQIVCEANRAAEEIVRAAKEKAASEGARELEQARELIRIEKERTIREIRSEIAALSVSVAEKILRSELAGGRERSFVERMIAEVEKSDGASATNS